MLLNKIAGSDTVDEAEVCSWTLVTFCSKSAAASTVYRMALAYQSCIKRLCKFRLASSIEHKKSQMSARQCQAPYLLT